MSTPASPRVISSSSTRTTTRPASTESTTPPRLAITQPPESRATRPSMPVPTSGVSVRTVGTAWRCWLVPMRARLASSCSRKGTSAAATDTSCLGETSMYWMVAGSFLVNSFKCRTSTASSMKLPSGPIRELAWAMT